jgi:hypothetical protein
MSKNSQVLNAALVSAMSPESDVPPPARARSASFASSVADLRMGDAPASKVMQIDRSLTIDAALEQMSETAERFRSSITSSVQQAKRRCPGAEYSIEISDIKIKSGMYLLALVHRTA